MDADAKRKIEQILRDAQNMTIATLRADGYPQATTVSYASDGLSIYFGTGAHSQKASNIARDCRVSGTVNCPYRSWDEIKGLSFAAKASRVLEPAEFTKIGLLMVKKFPHVGNYVMPGAEELALFRLTLGAVSILDYSLGFGHADLVTL
jgi:uncharacterized protein YhbP (UPF0306 family)